jgi:transcriptional regulator with XRE-family HTH domain
MIMSGSFSAWLKQRRQSMDLTQKELAEQVGCSTIGLRKIETGERRPSRQVAGLLAAALRVPEDLQPAFLQFARGDLTVFPPEMPGQPVRPAFSFPSPRTSLIGREQALSDLLDLLALPEVRLVTLLGPPGVGKTRLALRVAEELRTAENPPIADSATPHFPDGIIFVELAPVAQAAPGGNSRDPRAGLAAGQQYTGAGQHHCLFAR